MALFDFLSGGNKIKAAQSEATNALTGNFRFNGPGGSLQSKMGETRYRPKTPQVVGKARAQAATGILGAIRGLPKSFDVNSYYNNPFYETTRGMLQNPIHRQYGEDQQELSNSLNARNLLGGSYGALRENMLMRERDFNLNQAEQQARGTSADAYNQSVNQNLNILNQLAAYRSNQLRDSYIPAQFGLQAQNLDLQRRQGLANITMQGAAAQQQQAGNMLGLLPGLLQGIAAF